MTKQTFGDLLRTARVEKGMSLRTLAVRAGIDHSRLARIEQGTRPSPDLATTRVLADALDLDLATLLVSAGTAREVLDGLVWSERRDLAERRQELTAYDPDDLDLHRKNSFEADVVARDGSRCQLRIGEIELAAFTFSSAPRLRVTIPPEAVTVFRETPQSALGHAEGVFSMSIAKIRHLGEAANLVLAGKGLELNALMSREAVRAAGHAVGDRVHVLVPAAAIRTSTIREDR